MQKNKSTLRELNSVAKPRMVKATLSVRVSKQKLCCHHLPGWSRKRRVYAATGLSVNRERPRGHQRDRGGRKDRLTETSTTHSTDFVRTHTQTHTWWFSEAMPLFSFSTTHRNQSRGGPRGTALRNVTRLSHAAATTTTTASRHLTLFQNRFTSWRTRLSLTVFTIHSK